MRLSVALAGALALLGVRSSVARQEEVGHKHILGDPSHHSVTLPMLLDVGVFIDHFYGVNNKEGTFKANIYIMKKYDDKRNARPYEAPGSTKVFPLPEGKNDASFRPSCASKDKSKAEKICWAADVGVTNMIESRRIGGNMISIQNGTTEWIERLEATFETPLHFGEYPFDKQELEINVEPEHMFKQHMWLREWKEVVGVNIPTFMKAIREGKSREEAFDEIQSENDSLEPDLEWYVTGFRSFVKEEVPSYATTESNRERHDKEIKLRYVFILEIQRSTMAYAWNFITPTNFLAILSWSGFWIPPTALMPRVATSFIAYLTFLNFQQKGGSSLPLLTYTTWHDVYKLIANVFIFLAIVENMTCQYLHRVKGAHTGHELDVLSRALFPALFFLFQLLAYLLRNAELDILKILLFVVLTLVMLILWLHIHLKMKRLPGELWNKGYERSMQNKDMMKFVCLDDGEIELVFKGIDRDASSLVTSEELAQWILTSLKSSRVTTKELCDAVVREFGFGMFQLSDFKMQLHSLFLLLEAMKEGTYEPGMLERLQSNQVSLKNRMTEKLKAMHGASQANLSGDRGTSSAVSVGVTQPQQRPGVVVQH